MNIASVLQDQARRRGVQAAIVHGERSIAFAELNDRAAQAAATLSGKGLRPGDRALVFCPMSIELYVALIGLFRLGITAVFVDPSAGRRQIDACCDWLEPRGFAAVPRAHLLRLVLRCIRRVPVKVVINRTGVGGTRSKNTAPRVTNVHDAIEPCNTDTPALITFTSGSTGEPKAAMRTHGFLLAQHNVLAGDLELRPGDVDLTTLPIFVLANLASGVTSVIPDVDLRAPAEVDAARVLRRFREASASRTAASPALLERLRRHLEASGETLELSRVFTGGAPVMPSALDALARIAPGASITAIYGSTEAEPIARLDRVETNDHDRVEMRRGAGLLVGRPVSSIDVRVIPDRWGTALGPHGAEQFEQLILPAGGVGEIVVAGPHVLSGYLGGRGDTETKIRAGDRVWHRTGDAGYIDARGRLWLLGRCSARVSDARGTQYPLAVECAASDIAGVRRTAFVQHDGRRLLIVEPERSGDGPNLDVIRRRLNWACLDDVRIVGRIPVDHRHNGKVNYPALARLLRV
jgi:acyl-CoA synthetase (AMP-forming)/AMP-acid ligase II